MLFLNDITKGIIKIVIVNGNVQGITLYTDDTREDVQCTIVELVGTLPMVELDKWKVLPGMGVLCVLKTERNIIKGNFSHFSKYDLCEAGIISDIYITYLPNIY